MKAVEFLQSSAQPKALVVVGADETLKDLVIKHYRALVGNPDVEQIATKNLSTVLYQFSEPSLFGARLLVTDLQAPTWGSPERTFSALRDASENGDHVVIKAEKAPTKSLSPFATQVDCDLGSKKSREAVLKYLLEKKRINYEAEAVKLASERLANTAEINNYAQILSYVIREGHVLTVKDVERGTQDPPERRDLGRAVLTVNMTRIRKEVLEGEPMLILTILHGTLTKLYVYLTLSKDHEEAEIVEKMGMTRNQLKDYKEANNKYAAVVVRYLIELVNDEYHKIKRGRGEGWREAILSAFLRKLSKTS